MYIFAAVVAVAMAVAVTVTVTVAVAMAVTANATANVAVAVVVMMVMVSLILAGIGTPFEKTQHSIYAIPNFNISLHAFNDLQFLFYSNGFATCVYWDIYISDKFYFKSFTCLYFVC